LAVAVYRPSASMPGSSVRVTVLRNAAGARAASRSAMETAGAVPGPSNEKAPGATEASSRPSLKVRRTCVSDR